MNPFDAIMHAAKDGTLSELQDKMDVASAEKELTAHGGKEWTPRGEEKAAPVLEEVAG